MMSAADLVNWGFAWLLIGSVLWALMYAGGLTQRALRDASSSAMIMVAIGAIVGWPVVVAVFVAGCIDGMRGRVRR